MLSNISSISRPESGRQIYEFPIHFKLPVNKFVYLLKKKRLQILRDSGGGHFYLGLHLINLHLLRFDLNPSDYVIIDWDTHFEQHVLEEQIQSSGIINDYHDLDKT